MVTISVPDWLLVVFSAIFLAKTVVDLWVLIMNAKIRKLKAEER